jgi:hypothetical protein
LSSSHRHNTILPSFWIHATDKFGDKFRSSVNHILSTIGARLDKRMKGKTTARSQPIPVACLVEETVVASRTKRESATAAECSQSIHCKEMVTQFRSVTGAAFPVIHTAEDEEPNGEQRKAMWKFNVSTSMVKGKGKKSRIRRSSESHRFRNVSQTKRAADRDHQLN